METLKYPNGLKNRESGKEAPQILHAERATIAQRQGASEHAKFEEKPTMLEPDSSDCLGTKKPWFEEGLRFKCTGCGECCTGSPGYVYLSLKDLEVLSNHFGLTQEEFTKKYTRYVDGQYALLEDPKNFDCVFFKDKKCTVYKARPTQCRTFPWWVHHLRDPKDWEEAAKRCEGINHPNAELVPSLHIQEQCLTYLDNLLDQNFDL